MVEAAPETEPHYTEYAIEEFLVRDVTRLVNWINKQGFNADLADSMLRVLDEPVPELPELPGGD